MSTQNDDLLILTEDTDSIDFNISDELLSSNESSENIVSIDNNDFSLEETPKSNENTIDLFSFPEVKVEEDKTEDKPELKDVNFDFGNIISNSSEEKQSTSVLEENTISPSSFVEKENIEEEKVEVKSPLENNVFNSDSVKNDNIWSMAEILARTIWEFEQRENLIEWDISTKEEHISDLEKELESEKTLVANLKSEKSALEKNRKSLEKMKTDFENRDELWVKKTQK